MMMMTIACPSPSSLQWKEDSPVSSNKVEPTPQTQPPYSPKESSTNEKKSNRTKKAPLTRMIFYGCKP